MILDTIANQCVSFTYANLSALNRLRTWARKNNATVKMFRYAKDCYEGNITIQSPWNEHRDVAIAKRQDILTLMNEWNKLPDTHIHNNNNNNK